MTKKLFRQDAYLTHCTAKVVRVQGSNVVVDQTVLFAFSGGQATDKGTIGGIAVKEAICEGDEIVYVLEKEPPFKAGDTVEVRIDPQYRDTIRRLHSAAHIVGAVFEKKKGIGIKEVIGSNVDITKARLDYTYPEHVGPLLPELEKQVNDFCSQSHEVKRYSDPEKQDYLWWECEGIKMPCGGTHVKNTQEIGKIVLKRKNIGKGKERIEILLA